MAANPAQIVSVSQADLTWTDITSPGQSEVSFLAQKYGFHHLALEDSLRSTQLSKIDDYRSYLFLILHFPLITPENQVIKSTGLSIFINNNQIITLHHGPLNKLTDLFQECLTKEVTRQEYFGSGSGYLLYRIINDLVESCFPILDRLLTRMNDIEDSVFDENSDDTREIAVLRLDIIMIRRLILPSSSIIHELKTRIKPFTAKDLEVYFDSLLDQLNRMWENLEEAKEVLEVFKDSDFVLVTNRINRIVETLAIISSILIPFLVVSSIYGMNIDLPGGLESGNPKTFGILLGIMLAISGGMLYFMHRRRWI